MIEPIIYRRKMISKNLYLTFHPTDNVLDSKNYKNIRKVRCIALDSEKKVCMVSNDGISNWMIPGGTVERHENPILALKRELVEEADIEIKKYKLIGFLEVQLVNNATKYVSHHTEMIFMAKIDKILTQTEDPAKGFILQRDLFHISEMAYKFMRWGKISRYLEEYLNKVKL
jgi:8-oxo-dGTP pyrophosphatase MutT (NUDIX family)